MEFKGLRTGFALTGSFCTFAEIMGEVERLSKMGSDIIPIMSGNAYNSDTRLGRAEEFINRLEEISGKSVIHTIPQAEPIGPKAILDVLIIAPCTGNTLAKMANGSATRR
jgi:dipicolinate synthase subunit B